MTENIEQSATAGARLLPFMLDNTPVRGRIAHLDEVVSKIIARHDYPGQVAHLLSECLLVAALLAAQLKQQGIFTLQMKGKGPIKMLVADASFDGTLRGYAELGEQADAYFAEKKSEENPLLQELFGEGGHLAITFDAGGDQRYQGVVALEGTSVADAVMEYFNHSQQLNMHMMLAVKGAKEEGVLEKGGIKAAAMMIEQMPETAEQQADLLDGQEAWGYASVMMKTVKPEELLSVGEMPESLLNSLYHEQGVRVFSARAYHASCRCSRERIEKLLLSMAEDDRAHMLVDGKASVHCQFCNSEEHFSAQELGLTHH